VSLLVIKEVLGHRALSTTERYLHLLRETMCQELEAHPFVVEGQDVIRLAMGRDLARAPTSISTFRSAPLERATLLHRLQGPVCGRMRGSP
jgi:hypothetical protein